MGYISQVAAVPEKVISSVPTDPIQKNKKPNVYRTRKRIADLFQGNIKFYPQPMLTDAGVVHETLFGIFVISQRVGKMHSNRSPIPTPAMCSTDR